MMRWYGPADPVSLEDIKQAGCEAVVSALHHIRVGEIWAHDEIKSYQKGIEEAGLYWSVVESLPVHEEIKTRSGAYLQWIENYKSSIVNLGKCGIKVITYNFMPVLDWLRTDVKYRLENNAETLRFVMDEYAVFDLFMLKRKNAKEEYSSEELMRLKLYYKTLSAKNKNRISKNMLLGLPGSDDSFTTQQILSLIDKYDQIDHGKLRDHLCEFLTEVTPVAEKAGVQLAIHPDDPPFSVFGLPRIMCCEADIDYIMHRVPNPANGLCFCTGSYGARRDNDLIQMIRKWGNRIYFLHLRNTKFTSENGDFMEANHLEGDTNMYGVVKALINLMKTEKRAIPMRPDHGHKILDDRNKTTYPGYSAIGRLKGLAELRGLEMGISRSMI